ncbi:SMI1/KNR4 family protein [Tautonia sp. JC769]|uniref:SMI1/KNR4 family protein n=1 Tax=Tautonia sp. JC769 TaxID=3232135 RepID=UPI0034585830
MTQEEAAMVEEMKQIVGGDCFGPVPEETIAAAEQELGLPLPRSYRAFLRHFGAAIIGGYEIQGLPNTRNTDEEMAFWSHVVDTSRIMWDGYGGNGMPRHLVYVTDDGGGTQYYLDTSRMDDAGECPVVAFGNVKEQGGVKASNFFEFMKQLDAEDQRYQEWKSVHGEPKPEGYD